MPLIAVKWCLIVAVRIDQRRYDDRKVRHQLDVASQDQYISDHPDPFGMTISWAKVLHFEVEVDVGLELHGQKDWYYCIKLPGPQICLLCQSHL